MTDTGVQKYLLNRLQTLNDECEEGQEILYLDAKGKPANISYENVAFDRSKFMDKAGNYGWLDVLFVPFRHIQAELGTNGKNRWHGYLQINVCCPKGVGVKYTNNVFDAISKHFPEGHITDGLYITGVDRDIGTSDTDFFFTPVRIYWKATIDRK